MGDVGKLTELASAALWDLGLDLPEVYKGLDSFSLCIHDLDIVHLHLLQALLVLPAKEDVPQDLRVF